jgi:hypothetical protein
MSTLLASAAHIPTLPTEQQCQMCPRPATSVANGNPECNEHAGMRLLSGENPEILGAMLADYLQRNQDAQVGSPTTPSPTSRSRRPYSMPR